MNGGAVPKRILVACSMKSGSTYVSNVLARYLSIERIEPLEYWGRAEQNLSPGVLAPFRDHSFVAQMHLRPHPPNLELLREHGITLVYLWRNLGDVLVSFDDHIRNEEHRNPVCYVHDKARYLALPAQQRYRYLIRHAIPWYIAFHLAWQSTDVPVVRCRYEELAADAFSFFSKLLAGLGERVDEARLRDILARPIANTRFNRGINGRSLEALGPETQDELDELLLSHPEDLAQLWEELPWRGLHRPCRGSFLRELARCEYNRDAGDLLDSGHGVQVAIRGEGFFFLAPGALVAPGRLRLLVRGGAGSRFSVFWRGEGEDFSSGRARHASYRPSPCLAAVDLTVEENAAAFRLHCFNGVGRVASLGRRIGLGGPGPLGAGEIVECVRVDG